MPRYTCFVARPQECTRAFVRAVHCLTRSLDPATPYTDTIWGILCAATPADALAIAAEAAPLVIRKVLSGTVEGGELGMFESGVAYDELHDHVVVCKSKGTSETPLAYSYLGELIPHLVHDLNTGMPDMLITSGHARERVWYE